MKRVSLKDLKARLSAVVAEAESGGTIVITRHNAPVAVVGPARSAHVHRGRNVGAGRLRPALRRATKGRRPRGLDRRSGTSVIAIADERSARPRMYLDTSAYLCILLGEEGSDRLSAETGGAELLSSALLVLETKRNLTRLARDGVLTPQAYRTCMDRLEQDVSLFVLRDLTLDLCQSSVLPAVITPRSLDLAHLRTALWFHAAEPLDRFITVDGSQADAARELGLPT